MRRQTGLCLPFRCQLALQMLVHLAVLLLTLKERVEITVHFSLAEQWTKSLTLLPSGLKKWTLTHINTLVHNPGCYPQHIKNPTSWHLGAGSAPGVSSRILAFAWARWWFHCYRVPRHRVCGQQQDLCDEKLDTHPDDVNWRSATLPTCAKSRRRFRGSPIQSQNLTKIPKSNARLAAC